MMDCDPVCALFPLMTEPELQALAEDISRNGLTEPIWIFEGKILDGRNRGEACQRAGVSPRYREWDGNGSKAAFVWSMNGARRHLGSGQLAAVAVEMLPMLEKEAAGRQRAAGDCGKQGGRGHRAAAHETVTEKFPEGFRGEARDRAAQITGANPHYVSDAKRLKAQEPALFEQLKSGEITISKAKRIAKQHHVAERKQVEPSNGRLHVVTLRPAMQEYRRGGGTQSAEDQEVMMVTDAGGEQHGVDRATSAGPTTTPGIGITPDTQPDIWNALAEGQREAAACIVLRRLCKLSPTVIAKMCGVPAVRVRFLCRGNPDRVTMRARVLARKMHAVNNGG